ncbi:MAG: hypothetical protein M1823_003815 [Watsoniomyces obsoletus]|nr:MAG: hypothetical protein M1823_003815 [Watsoniomyces obsoletus]
MSATTWTASGSPASNRKTKPQDRAVKEELESDLSREGKGDASFSPVYRKASRMTAPSTKKYQSYPKAARKTAPSTYRYHSEESGSSTQSQKRGRSTVENSPHASVPSSPPRARKKPILSLPLGTSEPGWWSPATRTLSEISRQEATFKGEISEAADTLKVLAAERSEKEACYRDAQLRHDELETRHRSLCKALEEAMVHRESALRLLKKALESCTSSASDAI